jgi:hypothetical protein
MWRTSAALALTFVLVHSAGLSAKGATTRITLTGAAPRATVTITKPDVLSGFQIWAGPGVSVDDVEQTEGFIIDWKSGPIANPPGGLQRYEAAFYVSEPDQANATPAYIVTYAYDAASHRGYVYLPGKGDAAYALNSRAMFHGHGYEGHWFRATQAWDAAVSPLIAGSEP